MSDWLKCKSPLAGSVWFSEAVPRNPDIFKRLAGIGVSVTTQTARDSERWRIGLRHSDWGAATVVCPREIEPLSRHLIEFAWLSEAEKTEALRGAWVAAVSMVAPGENILCERKTLLRFLRATAGTDAAAVVDDISMRVWSTADLEDELSHDADLDVESLITIHAVMSEETGEVCWIHTHGLSELGYVDFDLVQPRRGLTYNWNADAIRALTAGILEGAVATGSGVFPLAHPGGDVCLIGAGEFLRSGVPYASALLRDMLGGDDGFHRRGRAIVCEPVSSGAVGRFLRGSKPAPIGFLWGENSGPIMTCFSKAATELMAQRARATYGVLRALFEEFRDFGFSVLVKLGYETGHGEDDEREHLWFEAHALDEDTVDATLVNQPFDVQGMSNGDRGRHPIDRLSDWAVFTPVGTINPRTMTAARKVREDPGGVRAAMRGDAR